MNWIDIIYNIIAVIGGVCIVRCIMWSWETQLSFVDMNWVQKGKVIIAKITIWSMILFLIYVFTAILYYLLR